MNYRILSGDKNINSIIAMKIEINNMTVLINGNKKCPSCGQKE